MSDLRAPLLATLDALDLEATEGQIDALLGYIALLQRWNAVYNLTAVREPEAMLVQHLADCLAVIPSLRPNIASTTTRILDVGSGGGLPAVVLSIMLPIASVTSLDTVGKKVAFVQQVAGELHLQNLSAVQARVETYNEAPFDLIVSRAFASLADFVRWTRPLLASNGQWLAMKGRRPNDEIAALPPSAAVFHVEQLTVPGLDAERCLVWLRPTSPSL